MAELRTVESEAASYLDQISRWVLFQDAAFQNEILLRLAGCFLREVYLSGIWAHLYLHGTTKPTSLLLFQILHHTSKAGF